MYGSAPRVLCVGLARPSRVIQPGPLRVLTPRGSRLGKLPSIWRLHGTRWYSSTGDQLQGVVVVKAPQAVKVDQLIETLPTAPIREDATYDAVFLFSRSLSHYAIDSELFLQPAMSRLSQDAGRGNVEINVLAAAVDQVPSNLKSGIIATHEQPDCSEGVAFHIAPSINGSNHLWKPSHTTSQEHALDRRRGGIVSFTIPTPKPDTSSKDLARSSTKHTICQIPLASTIFQTSLQSTLLSYRFARTQDSQTFHDTARSTLQSAHIYLPPAPSHHHPAPTLHAPLERLTDVYTVRASMGNIIRQVDAPDTPTSAGRPASQDLEQAISVFFSSTGIPPQPVSAYALVIPQAVAHEQPAFLAQLGGSTTDQSATLLTALQSGARLHRIVSGGGGWGKKAGLLALDPEVSMDGTRGGQFTAIDGILGPSDDYALHSVAAPGDLICFFIDVETVGKRVVQAAGSSSEGQVYVFGTAPSTIDDVEAGSAGDGGESRVEYVDGLFGAVSEGGMAYQELEVLVPLEKESGNGCRTRVDVPFARFSFQ